MKKRTPEQTEKKRAQEKMILKEMIGLYCRLKHKKSDKTALCADCAELLDYALLRTEKCPFMATKSFCSKCKVHCYKPQMREKIRQVMKFFRSKNDVLFSIAGNKTRFCKVNVAKHVAWEQVCDESQFEIFKQKGIYMDKFKIKDIVFLALISAVTMCTCAVMPLVISLQPVVFGISQAVTCTQISIFFTFGLCKVEKPGSLFIMALFMGLVQLLMAPVMFFSTLLIAVVVELLAFLIFRGFEKKSSLYFSLVLFNLLSLPLNVLYNYFFGKEALFQVAFKFPLVTVLMTLLIAALSVLGTFLGILICTELKKAGVFRK